MNGFEVLSCESIWHDYVLSAVVRKRKGVQLDNFWQQLDKIKKEIHAFVDKYKTDGTEVAVWGAGHQALAILALTEISGKIAFVVDSAEFKQNKYTPGTHLQIVSPEHLKLNEDKVGAVLVMAASYSDEVAGIVKENYKDMAVGILRDDGIEICQSSK